MKAKKLLCLGMMAMLACPLLSQMAVHAQEGTVKEDVQKGDTGDALLIENVQSQPDGLEADGSETHIHSYVSEITEEPGCTVEGIRTYVCIECNDTYTEKIPAMGHKYSIDVEPATASEDGRIVKYCDVCGDETITKIYAARTIKLSQTAYTYNGITQKPSVTVMDRKGKFLKNGEDYTVSYPRGMKNVGCYTVEIQFKGNYEGDAQEEFIIVPKGSGISKLTPKGRGLAVKWKKQTAQVTGYEIAFSTSSKFTKKTTHSVTVSKNKTVSRTLLTLKPKKRYYVKIRTYKNVEADGELVRLCSSWSKEKSAATKADPARKIPGLNAKVTTGSILKILDRYDKDGAYILRTEMAAGDDILAWFSGGDRIIDGIEVAIHEETHGYSHDQGSYSQGRLTTAYFIGKGRVIHVLHTDIYNSIEMASSIPKRLRTFRYDTYVAKPTENLSSNVQGAYGLMNEFMAYRMGMSTTVSLYQYYVDKNAGWDAWKRFINSCENDKLAYAEFKYYILHYLSYARQHHPEVYRGIVGNRDFCRAYRQLEDSFVKLIDAYEKDLKKIQGIMEEKGHTIKIDADWITNDKGTGTARFTKDYQKLQKEVKKPAYQSMHKALIGNGK